MKITILGAGAMGMLFGGYLSKKNEVWLLDIDRERVEKINMDGVIIREKDGDAVYHPKAVTNCIGLPEMDLVIVFLRAYFTEKALEANQSLIGRNTYVMTLQNGSGHEEKLRKFVDAKHVIIGSTQHNSSVISNGYANHGGGGKTSIGLLSGRSKDLISIAETMTACGIACVVSDDIQKQIWTKMFLNTSASSLTGVLQVPLGFIYDDPFANALMKKLAREAVAVANAEGVAEFESEQIICDIETVLKNGRGAYTSIYSDIKNGSRTEVDTISGSVVRCARKNGVPVPYHEMIVALIHAMEDKVKYSLQKE